MPKCQICKEREAYLAWQPFGPDESPLRAFSTLGSHYRGFPVVKVCDTCKETIYTGGEVQFVCKGTTYRLLCRQVVGACDLFPIAPAASDEATIDRRVAERDAACSALETAINEADALREQIVALQARVAYLENRNSQLNFFIDSMEANTQEQMPPAAPAPAVCRTCGGTGSVEARAHVMVDENGGEFATGGAISVPCPDCALGQECELCCGEGYYVKTICGELEELDCPACDGTGARRGTKLYYERQAKRAADLEAARNAPIPF